MSTTKLRHQPVQEQIAFYEDQIRRIDEKIAHAKEQRRIFMRKIHILNKPDAEDKQAQRDAQRRKCQEWKERTGYVSKREKEEHIAQVHQRMQREVEECLRMNGKTV